MCNYIEHSNIFSKKNFKMEAAPMKHAKNKDMDKTININLNSSQPSIDNIPVRRKIQKGKKFFLERSIKQGGTNRFQKYSYFRLDDIIPVVVEFMEKENMISWFDMKKRRAKLTICDLDSNTCAEYRIPLPKVEKANTTEAMKTIGALQTYAERYLYLQAFEIVVPDTIEQERPTTFKPQNIRE